MDVYGYTEITIDLIPLMDEEHLISLGVTLMGQRILLRNCCKQQRRGKTVDDETKSIFIGESSASSTASRPETLVSKATRLITELKNDPLAITERHTKKRRHPSLSRSWSKPYSKSLVVIDFRLSDSAQPESQILHDYDKVYDGVVVLSNKMTEADVRKEIVSLVSCKKSPLYSFADLEENDFEFVKCVNRRVRVIDGHPTFDGEGIKSLYKNGSVYVRLTRSFYKGLSSGQSDTPKTDQSPVTLEPSQTPSCSYATQQEVTSVPATTKCIKKNPPYKGCIILSSSDDECEDPTVQMAVQESLGVFNRRSRLHFDSSEQLIKHYFNKEIHLSLLAEDREQIIVRRNHVWNDTKLLLKKRNFNDYIGLNVEFIGEHAHDAGGPTREFFSLVLQKISDDANLFSGLPGARTLVHNILALEQRDFYVVGHVIALSLFYGGGAPHFFSKSVVAYLFNEEIELDMISEIADFKVKASLKRLLGADSNTEMQLLLDSDELSFRYDSGMGILSSSVTVEDKQSIVTALAKDYLVYNCKGELDQLVEGLSHLGVMNLIREFPLLMKPLFLSCGKSLLTPPEVLKLFKIVWSQKGSNRREAEEAVILGWSTYVQSCGGSGRHTSDGSSMITLSSILLFVTGTDNIPAIGFEFDPEIQFVGGSSTEEKRLPSASTCSLTLFLPLYLSNPIEFASKMDMAIINGQQFGSP